MSLKQFQIAQYLLILQFEKLKLLNTEK